MNVSIENFTSPGVYPSNDSITFDYLLMNSLRNGLLGLNLLFGVPTRCYVLWIIVQGRRFQSEFFNINLTVCELMYSLIFLFHVFQVVTNLELMVRFMKGLGVTGIPLFQCLMCLERYLAVVHPVIFLKYKPLRYRVICCSVVWIITFGSSASAITLRITSDLKVYAGYFSVQYSIFLSIQLFCLVAVLRALKHLGPGERRQRNEENLIKRRAFHLLLITTVIFIVMFSPFITIGFLCALNVLKLTEVSLIWTFSTCCYVVAGFVQPLVYLHRAGKLCCLCFSER